jgi:hypothetical protein
MSKEQAREILKAVIEVISKGKGADLDAIDAADLQGILDWLK